MDTRVFKAATLILAACSGAMAQVNQNCTVSVLNRSVPVNPDGSWVLPNIPANFGQVKARATCVQNGQTTFGESAFFTIPANNAVNLPAITLGGTTPIPVSLSLGPTGTTLVTAGQTLQLVVTATYPDGSSKDVTPGSAGTNYTTSNAAIASIAADGLVTAASSGTALIQATNDGATGILSLSVNLGGAQVGGIPVSWILANHLDPNDPTLPYEDPDRDGLTNLQEYQIGTDPNNPDTDGDGLLDGDEVNKYHTNPLVADTDGDKIPDGVEVQTGTDPLNPNSYDLKNATATSVLKPAAFVLSTSVLFASASQQLNWKINLIDGKTTLDLTADPRTSYSSSNVNVCNFGGQPGLVFAGSAGSCTITISQNTLSVTVSGSISAFTPAEISTLTISGAGAVDVAGSFAYVAAGSNGLVVVDVTDRTKPRMRGTLAGVGNANAVRVAGQYVLVADINGFLRVVQVANPDAPSLVASFPITGAPISLAIHGNTAAVAAQAGGVSLVDLSTPTAPILIARFTGPASVLGVDFDLQRGIAALAMGAGGLQLADLSNLAAPQLRGLLSGGYVQRVRLIGTAALLADTQRSVTAVDVSNPAIPVLSASTPPFLGGFPVDIAVFGSLAITADVAFGRAVPYINVSNPLRPQAVAFWNLQSPGYSSSIAMDASFGYLITPNTLHIAQYQQIVDNNGIPPSVQITSPVSGTQMIQGSSVTVKANATDDVAVAAVNFFVNGQLAFRTATTPYQYTFTAPTTSSTLLLGATAVDYGNNVGTATNVTLNLIPDLLTTVTGRVLNAGQPASGATVAVFTTFSGPSFSGTSAPDGTFTIAGVPTARGNLVVIASASINGTAFIGASAAVAPVAAGSTAVGDIALAPTSNGRFVFAAIYGSNGISGYSINPTTGALTPISGSPFPAGNSPYSVAVDPTGRFAYVANRDSNNVSGYSINPITGALTPTPASPFPANYPVSVAVDPTGRFAYVANGNSNSVSAYRISGATGDLTSISGSPFQTGTNPITVAVDPTARFAYVANGGSNNVSAYAIDPSVGALTPISGSPFPGTGSASSITVDPTGRFAYVTNGGTNGTNGVPAYSINAATGALTLMPSSPFLAGPDPSAVAVDPTGRFAYVANYDFNGSISGYSVDPATGALTRISGSPFPAGSDPDSIAIDPTSRFAYIADSTSNNISAYGIDTVTGALTPIADSPFPAGQYPVSVTAGSALPIPELVALSCSQESTLKSVASTTSTSIVFANATAQVRNLYELDNTGTRVLRSTLSSGQASLQNTFVTDPWVATDSSGQCLGIYLATNGTSRVTIKQ